MRKQEEQGRVRGALEASRSRQACFRAKVDEFVPDAWNVNLRKVRKQEEQVRVRGALAAIELDHQRNPRSPSFGLSKSVCRFAPPGSPRPKKKD